MSREPTCKTVADWDAKWQVDQIPFHQSDRHEMLVKHIDRLLQGRKNIRIFFPLCGKAVDLKWLYDEGHTIIGLEGSKKGVIEFFKENSLSYSTETVADGKMTLYKTDDNRLQIFLGDIYDFGSSVAGKMQGIWDRGSFVAINKDDRARYAKVLIDVMGPDCHYLLDTFQYDSSRHNDSPFDACDEDIEKIYGDKCNIMKIEQKDSLTDIQRSWGLSEFYETVLELTLK